VRAQKFLLGERSMGLLSPARHEERADHLQADGVLIDAAVKTKNHDGTRLELSSGNQRKNIAHGNDHEHDRGCRKH